MGGNSVTPSSFYIPGPTGAFLARILKINARGEFLILVQKKMSQLSSGNHHLHYEISQPGVEMIISSEKTYISNEIRKQWNAGNCQENKKKNGRILDIVIVL